MNQFEADAEIVLQILREKAATNPLLAAQVESASWQAAAIVERQARESANQPVAEPAVNEPDPAP